MTKHSEHNWLYLMGYLYHWREYNCLILLKDVLSEYDYQY